MLTLKQNGKTTKVPQVMLQLTFLLLAIWDPVPACPDFNSQSLPQAITMNSVLSSVRSLMQMFDGKVQEFISDIDNVHVVWLEEIQQEANRMFSR